MANTFRTSFRPEEVKVRFASCLLKDRAQDLWQEIGNELGDDVVDDMSWDEFSTRFQAEFAPAIEVQQLVMCHTPCLAFGGNTE